MTDTHPASETHALTGDGRRVASRLARCHWEVEVSRAFDRRTVCESFARKNGLARLASGAKRTVYAIRDAGLVASDRDCVLKVPHALTGYYENRSEVAWWTRMPDDAREQFLPVLDHGDGWLLVPRAETDVTAEEVAALAAALDEAGWSGEDLKPENVGRVDGRPVLLDYGKADFEGTG